MKSDKVKEIKAKTEEELRTLIGTLKERLDKLQFDLKSGKTAAIKEIRELRKEIAIAYTILNQHGKK